MGLASLRGVAGVIKATSRVEGEIDAVLDAVRARKNVHQWWLDFPEKFRPKAPSVPRAFTNKDFFDSIMKKGGSDSDRGKALAQYLIGRNSHFATGGVKGMVPKQGIPYGDWKTRTVEYGQGATYETRKLVKGGPSNLGLDVSERNTSRVALLEESDIINPSIVEDAKDLWRLMDADTNWGRASQMKSSFMQEFIRAMQVNRQLGLRGMADGGSVRSVVEDMTAKVVQELDREFPITVEKMRSATKNSPEAHKLFFDGKGGYRGALDSKGKTGEATFRFLSRHAYSTAAMNEELIRLYKGRNWSHADPKLKGSVGDAKRAIKYVYDHMGAAASGSARVRDLDHLADQRGTRGVTRRAPSRLSSLQSTPSAARTHLEALFRVAGVNSALAKHSGLGHKQLQKARNSFMREGFGPGFYEDFADAAGIDPMGGSKWEMGRGFLQGIPLRGAVLPGGKVRSLGQYASEGKPSLEYLKEARKSAVRGLGEETLIGDRARASRSLSRVRAGIVDADPGLVAAQNLVMRVPRERKEALAKGAQELFKRADAMKSDSVMHLFGEKLSPEQVRLVAFDLEDLSRGHVPGAVLEAAGPDGVPDFRSRIFNRLHDPLLTPDNVTAGTERERGAIRAVTQDATDKKTRASLNKQIDDDTKVSDLMDPDRVGTKLHRIDDVEAISSRLPGFRYSEGAQGLLPFPGLNQISRRPPPRVAGLNMMRKQDELFDPPRVVPFQRLSSFQGIRAKPLRFPPQP